MVLLNWFNGNIHKNEIRNSLSDQQLSCSWHQFTNLFSPIHEYFFNKIWYYDYFNDAVKCILMPPQDLEKWINKYFNKNLVDWWIDVTSKINVIFETPMATLIVQDLNGFSFAFKPLFAAIFEYIRVVFVLCKIHNI